MVRDFVHRIVVPAHEPGERRGSGIGHCSPKPQGWGCWDSRLRNGSADRE
ncbi:acyl-CoA dehydrogenase domain protein [Mycobacterium ulcerans str. Harvey]|uniref:Acyl-CoA dehydrogenase domain protein n=1 Tax=Mycobacterium ulcerans str. Harvey TaxID=1299332 RepID=A0ABP3AHM3_MYCUL|nr:acyl-CoA dehydrogenase domain protein [Mycobacterium ulcerans str. Harvey]